MNKLDNLLVNKEITILSALKKMDEIKQKLLIVVTDGKFDGLVSIGDLQRAIIKNLPMNTPIKRVMRRDIKYGKIEDSRKRIKEIMLNFRIEYMPILNDRSELVDLVFWEEIIEEEFNTKWQLKNPVVIMAGGEGKRLRPLTNVIPKPLFPYEDKTIIEKLLESYYEEGAREFYISVNFKKKMIKEYLSYQKKYQITYLEEEEPYGTAGSLKYLQNMVTRPFFVNNCDIIIKHNYGEIMDFHQKAGNAVTLVAAVKNIKIPYGTVETGPEGRLINLIEKPEITYMINTGLYILNPEVLELIPSGKIFNMTDLFSALKNNQGKIGVFPVSEKTWEDIGEWRFYRKVMEDFA
ncbi:MAG: NTP transferase domain-containing protein [Saprospiraceae bacterium]|nr:NTP transferase domain-containing protein [Saprospiraceae bacterium]